MTTSCTKCFKAYFCQLLRFSGIRLWLKYLRAAFVSTGGLQSLPSISLTFNFLQRKAYTIQINHKKPIAFPIILHLPYGSLMQLFQGICHLNYQAGIFLTDLEDAHSCDFCSSMAKINQTYTSTVIDITEQGSRKSKIGLELTKSGCHVRSQEI